MKIWIWGGRKSWWKYKKAAIRKQTFLCEWEKKFSNVCWSIWARRLCFMSCLGNLFHRFESFSLECWWKSFSLFPFSWIRIIALCCVRAIKFLKTNFNLNAWKAKFVRLLRLWTIFAIKHTHLSSQNFARKRKTFFGKYEKFSWKF